MLTLETLFTSRAGFGVETATNLQRAICRASDGLDLDDLWDDPVVREGFGGARPPSGVCPEILVLLSAIRAGKSTLAAAKAVLCSQVVNLEGLIHGDEIRIPVLATDKDAARATFTHMAGMLQAKPALRKLLIGEPTADSLWLRHPSGFPIEVKVTALSKYGSTVVSRWLAGCIFDEAPRMAGIDDGVRNLTEALHAIRGRILAGGQIWLPGSPWAPVGPVYDMVQECFGKPDNDRKIYVIRAGGPAMNPLVWTPEKCAELQRSDPKAYRTDVEAKFSDPEEAICNSDAVESSRRPSEAPSLTYVDGHHYVAAMDPATRSNAWTFAIAEHAGMGGPGGLMPVMKLAHVQQWQGTSDTPLRPFHVLSEIKEILESYGLNEVYTDQAFADALIDLGNQIGITVVDDVIPTGERVRAAETVARYINHGCFELAPDKNLRNDLIAAKKRATANGVTLVLPKTSDSRHCDYFPVVMLLLRHVPEPPDEDEVHGDPMLQKALDAIDQVDEDDFEADLLLHY